MTITARPDLAAAREAMAAARLKGNDCHDPSSGQFCSGGGGAGGGGGSAGAAVAEADDESASGGTEKPLSDFQAYGSGAAAEKDLAASAERWSEGDDYFANKGIKEYAGTSDSFRINDCLRKGCADGRLNDSANNLSSLLDKAEFPKDVRVSRAINPKTPAEREAILSAFKSRVGKEFADPAFVSTTANKKYAAKWGSGDEIKCTVLVPKGAKAAYLPKGIVSRQEWEVLIQRGSKFRVREASDDGVVLELLK